MTIEQQVLEKLRTLPPEKQKEVLDCVDSLKKNPQAKPLRNLRGLWKDMGMDEITEEDIAEMRRDMLVNFPRKLS